MKNLFFVLVAFLYAQQLRADVHIELPVKVVDTAPLGKEYTLTMGIDSKATDCLDTVLGEVDMPPPPPGFFPVLVPGCTDPDADTPITLHKDYRPIPSEHFSTIYTVKLYRGTERKPVQFRWDSVLPLGIDSAFLMIEFVDTVNLASASEYVVANEFVTDLQIQIFYTIPTVGVEEPEKVATGKLFPIPATEHITARTAGYEGGVFEVYSTSGQRCLGGVVTGGETPVYIGHLPRGEYWIRFIHQSGQSTIERFLCW